MEHFEKWHRILQRMEAWLMNIAALCLFLIMIIVVLDVLMRYGLNQPFSWSYELIALYLMVLVFFFALSGTLDEDAHIAVDILHANLKPRTRHACLAIGYWLSLVLFAIILWTSAHRTWISFVNHDVTAGAIQWPMWLSQAGVPIGVFLLMGRVLLRALGHTLSTIEAKNLIPLPLVSGYEKE